MMVPTPDQIIVHAPQTCAFCQQDLRAEPIESIVRRQVFDLPVPKVVVSEHRVLKKHRSHCLTAAAFPEDVTATVQYGPVIQAIGVYLSQVQLLPDAWICQLMQEVLGVSISSGSLHNWIDRCGQQLVPIEQEIKTALQQVPVMHQDEAGLYVAGQRVWMHVASTAALTHYAVHLKRGRQAMDEIGILPQFHGVSVHDGWASYQGYLCSHALCNVHHLRELTFLEEMYQQAWATELEELLLQMKAAVEWAKQQGQTALSPAMIQQFEASYQAWLRQADCLAPTEPPPQPGKRGRPKRGAIRCLLDSLRSQQAWVLAFLHDFAIPY